MLDERDVCRRRPEKSQPKEEKEEDDLVARVFISSEMDKVKRQIVFYKKKVVESEEKIKALDLLQAMVWRREK